MHTGMTKVTEALGHPGSTKRSQTVPALCPADPGRPWPGKPEKGVATQGPARVFHADLVLVLLIKRHADSPRAWGIERQIFVPYRFFYMRQGSQMGLAG